MELKVDVSRSRCRDRSRLERARETLGAGEPCMALGPSGCECVREAGRYLGRLDYSGTSGSHSPNKLKSTPWFCHPSISSKSTEQENQSQPGLSGHAGSQRGSSTATFAPYMSQRRVWGELDGAMGLNGFAILTGGILAAEWGMQRRNKLLGGPCGLLSTRRGLVHASATRATGQSSAYLGSRGRRTVWRCRNQVTSAIRN